MVHRIQKAHNSSDATEIKAQCLTVACDYGTVYVSCMKARLKATPFYTVREFFEDGLVDLEPCWRVQSL